MDTRGRVTLPTLAQPVATADGTVCLSSRGETLLLRRDGTGVPTALDARGRLRLPEWLRRRVPPGGAFYLAARRPDASTALLAPVACLDVIADGVAGEEG